MVLPSETEGGGVHERIIDVSGDSRRGTDRGTHGGTGPRGDRRGEKIAPPSRRRGLRSSRCPDYRGHRTAQRFDATGSVVQACTQRGKLAGVVRPTRNRLASRTAAAVSVRAASDAGRSGPLGD